MVGVTLDKSGEHWRGDTFDDLAASIRDFRAGGYPVATVVESRCGRCDGRAFRVEVSADESSRRTCVACGDTAFIGDSAEHWDDGEREECACPCGNEAFAAGVGFAFTDDGEIRWVSLGLRCLRDGVLGVYADVKIDYSPSRHLLEQA